MCNRNILFVLLLVVLLAANPAGATRLTIETDHFLIHFDEKLISLAERAAVIAEEVHDELVPQIGPAPKDKTHLILLDDTDLANGYADPLLYPKMGIFVAAPTHFSPYASGMSPRMTDWLRLVIHHEYAHILQLDMNDGIGATIERFLGRVPIVTNPMMLQSFGFIEGFATYYETTAGLGGRGDNPFYRMFLRTMVLDDDILSLDQVLGHYPLERWNPGTAVYLYGYELWQWMADRYGEDALRHFNETFARTSSLPDAFKETLNTTPDEFYEAWQADLVARFSGELAYLRTQGVTPTEPFGGYGYVPESPVASPDGSSLAYASVNGPVAPALRLIRRSFGQWRDQQLVAGLVMGSIAWSADGTQLYYAKVDAEGSNTYSDLYRYDLNSGKEERVTKGLRAFGPSVSADGRRLVFSARDGLATRLYELDLNKANSYPIRAGNAALREILPADDAQRMATDWFPDGRHILVTSHEPGGGMDLLRLDPVSRTLTPLVVGSRLRGGAGIVNSNPRFTPDGRFILFDSDRTGIYNLYAYELATGQTYSVARSLTGLFAPTILQTQAGPKIVAMEYTSQGYRLSTLPYAPDRWEPARLPVPEGDNAPIVRVNRPAARGEQLSSEQPVIRITPIRKQSEFASDVPVVRIGPGSPPPTETEDRSREELASMTVRPYSPWSSLRPRFVIPLFSMDEEGPVIGITTFGYDPLNEHEYSLTAGYGVISRRPELDFQYISTLLGNSQARWGVHIMQSTVLGENRSEGVVHRGGTLVAGYEWPGLFSGTALRTQAYIGEQQSVVRRESTEFGPIWPVQALSAELSHFVRRPVDDKNLLLESQLAVTKLQKGLKGGEERQVGYLVTLHEAAAVSWNLRRTVLDGTLTLGTSDLADGFTLGSLAGGPGFQPDWSFLSHGPQLTGRHAARFVIGLNQQVWRIQRGFGVWPFFLDDVGTRIYLEGGAAWSSLNQPPSSRFGVGAEASLTMYAGYSIPVTLHIGAAAGLQQEEHPFTLYIRLTFDDVLGGD